MKKCCDIKLDHVHNLKKCEAVKSKTENWKVKGKTVLRIFEDREEKYFAWTRGPQCTQIFFAHNLVLYRLIDTYVSLLQLCVNDLIDILNHI